jgi:hypothetical protein
MNFEVQNALRDLHERTPGYFLQEIFHHGDLKVRTEALKVLGDIDPKRRTTRLLLEMLRITP